jgi:pimeloyl-ACP methyl ester carboxylesterase
MMKADAEQWRSRPHHASPPIWRRAVFVAAAGSLLLLTCCATPIQVERVEPRDVERELNSNVLSTGRLSELTRIILHREDLLERFQSDPEGAIASLHRTVAMAKPDPDIVFALAEMSFSRARESGKRSYSMAAAIYAYAFLFPEDPKQRPSGFDPRLRTASDIYNRGLASAIRSTDRSRVRLRSRRFDLPFGSIDVTYDPTGTRWGNQVLHDFTPADELLVKGLTIRYRRPGIGASLAADASPQVNSQADETGFQVDPDVKIPVTALLRIDLSRHAQSEGHLHGTIEVHPAFEPSDVNIAGQSVPLEADTSTAFAVSLSNPKVWESEFAGFLNGDFFDQAATQLVGLEPYRRGQVPVVFIHGTGSSSGRWANLINDLQSDPVIREGFQFWSFSYATGNPTVFSALQLRTTLADAVRKLDPEGKDPALRKMILIGHSQGGLLAKWMSIDSGSRLWDTLSTKPPEELRISAENAAVLRRALFVTPLPEVRRVIFIATPHHGSFVAESSIGQILARFASPSAAFLSTVQDATADNPDALKFRPESTRFGSVWSMSGDNPLLKAFAAIPVSPRIVAHSIIAVDGTGPVETGDDGVVTYQSAHIPEAASELVVRSDHSVQANPQTVREVRRILLRHREESCPQGCTPLAPVGSRPLADATGAMQRIVGSAPMGSPKSIGRRASAP